MDDWENPENLDLWRKVSAASYETVQHSATLNIYEDDNGSVYLHNYNQIELVLREDTFLCQVLEYMSSNISNISTAELEGAFRQLYINSTFQVQIWL